MKPSLYIQASSATDAIIYNSDDNEWRSGVTDLRDCAIGKLGIEIGKRFRFVIFKSNGFFIGTGKTVSGGEEQRDGTYNAAWLYFPKECLSILSNRGKVSGWLDKLDTLRDEYFINNPTEDPRKIFDGFRKNLPDANGKELFFVQSAQGEAPYAVRTYKAANKTDDNNVEDDDVPTLDMLLLPEFIYQPGYENYKGIILIEDKPIDCQLEDLADNPLIKSVSLDAKFPRDISAEIPSNAFVGDKLNIEYKHTSGLFLPFTHSYTVPDNGKIMPPDIDWELPVDPSSLFVVVDTDSGEKVDAKVCINGNPKPMNVKKSEANVQVLIRANGYKELSKSISLLDKNGLPRQMILIQLKQQKDIHHYNLKMKDGTMHTIEIEEPQGKFESPLNGFVLAAEENDGNSDCRRLIRVTRMSDKGVQKFMAIAAVAGLLIGLLVGWLLFDGDAASKSGTQQTITVQQ